jgi:hypothetical protein
MLACEGLAGRVCYVETMVRCFRVRNQKMVVRALDSWRFAHGPKLARTLVLILVNQMGQGRSGFTNSIFVLFCHLNHHRIQ